MIFCSASRARRSRRQVLQIFTLQTLVDSTNSYQKSLAMEHVDCRIVQIVKKKQGLYSLQICTYLATELLSSGKCEKGMKFNQINICQTRVFAAFSCWTPVHVAGLRPLQKSGTDEHIDSQTRTAL